MLRHGHCPACHSRTVRRSAGGRPGDAADAPRPFGPAAVTRYECALCGYAEEWVEDPADLEAVRRRAGVRRSGF